MKTRFAKWLSSVWDSSPGAHPPGAWLLDPLEDLYRVGMRLRLRSSATARAPIPVISVGSIWSGGAGKTPLAAEIARIAIEEGIRAAIVLRGYGGRIRGRVERVPGPCAAVGTADPRARDEAGREAVPPDPSRYGDEAVLHAMRGTAPVYVAPDRLAGVLRAAQDGCALAILDDGMQHRRLARDLEIVSLPADRPLGNGRLLPRGPLREPAASLARADVIVLAHAPRTGAPPGPFATAGPDSRVIVDPAEIPPGRSIPVLSWSDRLSLRPILLAGREPVHPLGRIPAAVERVPPAPRGATVGLLCAIARPEPFRIAVEDLGYPVAWCEAFADHHRFEPAEIARVISRARRDGIRWIVTSEKDELRLARVLAAAGAGADADAPAFLVAVLSLEWNEPGAEARLRSRVREVVRGPQA